MNAVVTAVSKSNRHRFHKHNCPSIRLVAGLGVDGDVHAGATVRHRSRRGQGASQPNLRQVHLMHEELHDELNAAGFCVSAGELGENITTRGLDLLGLPAGTRLGFDGGAVVEVTGLRNPCVQLDQFQPGLMAAMLDRDPDGKLLRKSGIMAIVVSGGEICAGSSIVVELPPMPHEALQPV